MQVCYSAINNLLCIFFGSSLCHLLALLHSEQQGEKHSLLLWYQEIPVQFELFFPSLYHSTYYLYQGAHKTRHNQQAWLTKERKRSMKLQNYTLLCSNLSHIISVTGSVYLWTTVTSPIMPVTCSIWGTSCTDRFLALNINSESPQCLWGREQMQVHEKQTQWMIKFMRSKIMNWNRMNCKTPYDMRNPSSTQW